MTSGRLPPLANVFAVWHANPTAASELAERLRAAKAFASIKEGPSGWVVASEPLPHGRALPIDASAHQVHFAEGADVVLGHEPQAEERLRGMAAVTAHQPRELGRLRGDFGFVVTEDGGWAVAVRSCGGLVPLYIRTSFEQVVIATRTDYIVRFLREDVALDPLVYATWFGTGGPWLPDHRSFLQGVMILPRGHFARVGPGVRLSPKAYWQPRVTGEHIRMDGELPGELRRLLAAKLTRDLDPTGGNLLSLSGGVDSSALGAFATTTLGLRVSTLTFLPVPPAQRERERRYLEALATGRRFVSRHERDLDHDSLLRLMGHVPLVASVVTHPVLCALSEVVAVDETRVLFGGEFADEICGSVHTLPDWFREVPLSQAVNPRKWPLFAGRRRPAEVFLHQAVSLGRFVPLLEPQNLPAIFKSSLQEEFREWRYRRRTAARRDPYANRYQALRGDVDGWVAMNWEVCSALRVRRSLPFFNREMLELGASCHPAALVDRFRSKLLLRRALAGDVPALNLLRPDWSAVYPEGRAAAIPQLPSSVRSAQQHHDAGLGQIGCVWLRRAPERCAAPRPLVE